MKDFFNKAKVFLQDIKIEHSIFALPFAYLGLFFAAEKIPGFFLFFWITVAMVSFRTMAMGLNRLVDRSLDAANPRTQGRALPQKKLRVSTIWILTAFSFLVFEWSAYQLGPLCVWLSWIPVALAGIYPFTKHFTWLSHFVLGLILGIAPYGAWIASRQEFSWVPAFMTLGVMTWVAGFDMIYALQDVVFDRQHGLYSFPAKFGEIRTLQAAQVLHALSVFCWGIAGLLNGMGLVYGFGLLLVVCFLIREHQLIRSFGMTKISEAFFVMNGFVSVGIFLAAVLDVLSRFHKLL